MTKIVFTGLDNVGKTSIILALQREFEKIAIVKPTKGAKRRIYEFLGTPIAEWDLGGQQKYRQDYLTNPQFLDMSDIAIYVIDVQNKNRVVESINFLKAVIKRFNEFSIEPPIYIFFHKFDPVKSKNAQEELDNLASYLEHRIQKAIEYPKLIFYKTSIFNPSTIINAMSLILISIFPKKDILQKTIEDFSLRFKAEGVEIIDNNSLIIASYYKNEKVKEILNDSTLYFLNLNDILVKTNPQGGNNTNLMQIERMGKFFLFKQFSINDNSSPYHLLLYKFDQLFDIEIFNTLVDFLKGLLYN